jgi:hypothetical protein
LELGEVLDGETDPEPPPAAVLDAAEGHLWFVVDRLVVDVDDSRLQANFLTAVNLSGILAYTPELGLLASARCCPRPRRGSGRA